jgi:hypothetical protein
MRRISVSETPKVGDRIRVLYVMEGVVTRVNDRGTIDFGDTYFVLPQELETGECKLEILERAKPKWQDGDVAEFLGSTRFYLGGEWFTPSGPYMGQHPSTNEYKLIMRDGKPIL